MTACSCYQFVYKQAKIGKNNSYNFPRATESGTIKGFPKIGQSRILQVFQTGPMPTPDYSQK